MCVLESMKYGKIQKEHYASTIKIRVFFYGAEHLHFDTHPL